MDDIIAILKNAGFRGEIDATDATRDFYSHDASMFEIRPELVVAPRDSADVQTLIRVVGKQKSHLPNLSVTARSAGTDMAGGAINESIIVDFSKHFTEIG